MDLSGFEAVDWDDEEDDDGNLAHCLRHGIDELVVDEVLAEAPAEIKMKVETAEFVLIGPDRGGKMWTILFDRSYKRGDWLRPITGWPSEPREVKAWKRARGAA